jgi:hypothetical protein
MSDDPIDLPDGATLTVRWEGKEICLDLWQVHNELFEARQAAQGKPLKALHDAVVRLLDGYGVKGARHNTAVAFMNAVNDAMAEKKSAGPDSSTPASAASTAPPPPSSPTA